MNKIFLKGNITSDIDFKITKNNKQIASFGLATNDGFGDNAETNWHRCTAFGKQAEVISQHFTKGSQILVLGRLHYNQYENKEGIRVTKSEIWVNEFEFCGNKPKNQAVSEKQQLEDMTKIEDIPEEQIPF